MSDQARLSCAKVLGEVWFERRGEKQALPPGQVGALLRWMLLRPNETHGPDDLVELLWADAATLDEEMARSRLHVVVSRLRRILGTGDGDESGELRVVTEPEGYRLHAPPDALDRVAFETLVERAVSGEPELVPSALALWRGDPYLGFPPSEELERQRAHLLRLHRKAEQLLDPGDEETTAPSLRDRFVRTKFVRPRVGSPPILPRPRLVDQAGPAGEVPLVAVTAPAGFGKSVLLAQWAEAQPGPVAWVTVEAEDNDPVRFGTAVLQGFAEVGRLGPASMSSDAAPGSSRFLDGLAGVLGADDAAVGLVLDDLHNLVNTELLEQLWGCVAQFPSRITVAVGARSSGLPVVEPVRAWRGREVTAADLRFDPDEMLAVMRFGDPAVDPSDVAAVAKLTEGWPIAVSCLGSGRPVAGTEHLTRALHEYVVDEVLSELPAEVRSFLLATAHLDRFTVALCDAVTGTGEAERQLSWLRERALFVGEVDAATGWYRYHYLFAEVLRQQAEADPLVDAAAGHQRAARWFRTQGLGEEALAHAIQGGDDAAVAAVAGDVLWPEVRRHISAGQRWLHLIDPDVLAADRSGHDVAMLAAAAWLDPDCSAAWMASRRRHYGGPADPLLLLVAAHEDLLRGNARASTTACEAALALAGPYFDGYQSLRGVREHVVSSLEISRLRGRLLGGELPLDAPELAQMAELARRHVPALVPWVTGERAFLAYVEGDRERAAALLSDITPHLAPVDRTATYLGAPRALVTKVLLESDRAGAPAQRRIVRRLELMLVVHRELRWATELVCVLLALHVVCARAGELAEAAGHAAQADFLLGLCQDVPLLRTARAQLDQGSSIEVEEDRYLDDLLTKRELMVLEHLDAGLTYAEIAEALDTSLHTIRSHTQALYRKLGVRSRHGAVRCRSLREAGR